MAVGLWRETTCERDGRFTGLAKSMPADGADSLKLNCCTILGCAETSDHWCSVISAISASWRIPGPAKAADCFCGGQTGAEFHAEGPSRKEFSSHITTRQTRASDLLS